MRGNNKQAAKPRVVAGVRSGQTLEDSARRAGVSPSTVVKWRKKDRRFHQQLLNAMQQRSSDSEAMGIHSASVRQAIAGDFHYSPPEPDDLDRMVNNRISLEEEVHAYTYDANLDSFAVTPRNIREQVTQWQQAGLPSMHAPLEEKEASVFSMRDIVLTDTAIDEASDIADLLLGECRDPSAFSSENTYDRAKTWRERAWICNRAAQEGRNIESNRHLEGVANTMADLWEHLVQHIQYDSDAELDD